MGCGCGKGRSAANKKITINPSNKMKTINRKSKLKTSPKIPRLVTKKPVSKVVNKNTIPVKHSISTDKNIKNLQKNICPKCGSLMKSVTQIKSGVQAKITMCINRNCRYTQ